MSEWKDYKLGDVADISTGYAFKGDEYEFKGKLRVVRGENVTIGNLRWDSEKYWNKSTDNLGQYFLEENDIVIGMDGSRVGHNRAKIKSQELPLILAQRVARLRAKNNFDQGFLWYHIFSDYFKDYVEAVQTGTSIPHISQRQIADFEFLAPKLKIEQTAIATVLSSLDNKIDLLHRQNASLEKMAETLFRQWFVEEAKEEWEEGTLDDILSVKGGTTPSTNEPAYWNGTLHWTSPRDITNLNGIYLFETERKITEIGLSKISSGLLPKGTLLMSSRAPVGVLAFCEVPVAINQGYIAILDNKGYSKEFIYLWLKTNIEVVHSFSNGSTFMEISKSAFKTLQLQIPPKQLLDDFQILVKPLFDKIKSNQTQIRTLTVLRDTLLPKLMSGEVRVDLKDITTK
jgi:type I restriction enzyme, S subunit